MLAHCRGSTVCRLRNWGPLTIHMISGTYGRSLTQHLSFAPIAGGDASWGTTCTQGCFPSGAHQPQIVKTYPTFFGSRRFNFRVYASPPLVPIQILISPNHPTQFLDIYFDIILPSMSRSSADIFYSGIPLHHHSCYMLCKCNRS
jgi:hypothetical protein